MARRNPKLDKIYEVFDKHGVDIDRDAIWEVQGTPVVKHKDVERLGAVLGVKWDVPQILRAERDEAVIMVIGRMGDKLEWSIGEALISLEGKVGGNYKVKGKMAAYPYAMAEKRGKDRVILKLADLHGEAYSSEEADDFKEEQRNNRSSGRASNDNAQDNVQDSQGEQGEKQLPKITQDMLDDIDKCEAIKDLTDLMNSKGMKADMQSVSKDDEQLVRDHATKKLKALGWTKPEKAANG